MRRLVTLWLFVAGCGSHAAGGTGGTAAPITQDVAARACIIAHACGLPLGMVTAEEVGVTGCSVGVMFLNDAPEATSEHIGPSEVDCIAKAGSDCDAVASCLNDGKGAQPCKQSSGCDGSVILSCRADDGATANQTRFDCASFGEICTAGQENACVDGTCTGQYERCDGNVSEICEGGVLTRTDCSAQNATCSTTGLLPCVSNAPACTPVGDSAHFDGLRCEGTTLITCAGHEQPRDCAQFGLGCFAFTEGNVSLARCQAGSQCDPFATAAACNGTMLTFCNDGLTTTIDCAALGFATCSADNGGQCSR
jgi:hypothetical protein